MQITNSFSNYNFGGRKMEARKSRGCPLLICMCLFFCSQATYGYWDWPVSNFMEESSSLFVDDQINFDPGSEYFNLEQEKNNDISMNGKQISGLLLHQTSNWTQVRAPDTDGDGIEDPEDTDDDDNDGVLDASDLDPLNPDVCEDSDSDGCDDEINKCTPAGGYFSSWFFSEQGRWEAPRGIALDNDENFYIGDSGNDRILKFDWNHQYITQWGSNGSGPGQFFYPKGVAVDSNDIVWVVDQHNCRIQAFTAAGAYN